MKCPECKSTQLAEEFFDYNFGQTCGIEGVIIESAKRLECNACHNVIVNLGMLNEIELEIARHIAATVGLMPASQARFIRKRFYKLNVDDFAKLMNIDAVTVHTTEQMDLKYNEQLSEFIRTSLAARLMEPKTPFTLTMYDEKIEIKPKKKR